MANFEETIERASQIIDPAVFQKLLQLTRVQPWLESVSRELAELWNLCDNDEERSLVEDLIRRYIYVDSGKMLKLGQFTATQVCVDWGLTEDSTLVVATSDNWQADGSQAFIQSLKNKFVDYGNWKNSNFCNRIGDSLNLLNGINHVILVDDFIGTGKTITRRLNWYRKQLKNKNLLDSVKLYIMTIAAMEFSKPALDALDVTYYSPLWLEKGISEHYEGDELSNATETMEQIEAKLAPTINGKACPSFGYDKSESLFALEPYNVPNNVFPVFWWPENKSGKRRKTLFKRLA